MNNKERLKSILEDQVAGYRDLLDILRQERERLVQFDALAVEELAKEKDTIVLRLRLLEQERIRLSAEFAAELGVPAETSLLQLSEHTGDPLFRELRNRLLSLLQGISEMNEFNRVLLERSTATVKNALQFLSAIGCAPVQSVGTVCSREV